MHHHDAWTAAYDPGGPLWPWLFSHTFGDWVLNRVPEDAADPDAPANGEKKDDDDPDHFRAGTDEHGFETNGDLDDPNYGHLTNSLA